MTKQSKNATTEENQKVEATQKVKSEEIKKTDKPAEELKLTDEQWTEVFKHPRFTQLNEKAKEADKLKEATDLELQKKLKEEGKFKELLEEREKEVETLKSSLSESRLNSEIVNIASKLKVVDTEAVVKLLDKSKLMTGTDGNYLNTEEVVRELLTQKPYLAEVSTNDGSNIGSKANATTKSQSGEFIISKSELTEKLKDHKWYLENKEDIDTWTKEGRIDYSK